MSSQGYRRRMSKRYVLRRPLRLWTFLAVISLTLSMSISAALQKPDEIKQPKSVPLPAVSSKQEKTTPVFNQASLIRQDSVPAGTKIDEYKNIPVYSNGTIYTQDHGLSYSDDGYYYGYKWQCVEYVKRFYYDILDHEMPDGAGHAKYFFNPMLSQGEFNEQRGLFQYKNGGNAKPQPDDLLVFNDGAYGHVAIITAVGDDWVEVIQQNMEYSRQRLTLTEKNGNYFMTADREPAGWLRK